MSRLQQVFRIAEWGLGQLSLGARGKAYPIAELDNLAWFASKEKKLPTTTLDALFPGIRSLSFELMGAVPRLPGNLTPQELCVAAMVCRRLRARRIFEFGTYNGRTTLNLALNMPPDGQVFTLDLPQPGQTQFSTDRQDDKLQLGDASGGYYRQSPVSSRVQQLWSDSAVFDESPFAKSMDLVFVDASHTYEYVRNDTTKALAMLREGGAILWHDYCVWYPGVVRCLHELQRHHKIWHIEGTLLAMMPPATAPGITGDDRSCDGSSESAVH